MNPTHHPHPCVHAKDGCQGTVWCSNAYLERFDGSVGCGVNPLDELACEDCESSACSECGSVLNVARHADECSKATQV